MTTHIQKMYIMSSQSERKIAPRPGRRTTRHSFWLRFTFLLPLLLYLAVFFGYPLYYSLSISFERYDLAAEIVGSGPFIGLANYLTILESISFHEAALHTLLFLVCSIIPQFVLGLTLALFFKREFPFSHFLRSLILLPWLLPLVVTGTIWRWLFDQTNGVIDQLLATLHILPAHFAWLTTPGWALAVVIMANIWIGIPFNMVLLYSGLQGISDEYYEAAAIDGASKWTIFWRITFPLLRPVTNIVLMLGFIYTIKVFDIIYTITNGGPANATQIFATWAYNLSFVQQLFGQGAALGNIILIVSVLVSLVYLRHMQRTA